MRECLGLAYSCDGNLYLFGMQDKPTVDQSTPIWTALFGEIPTGAEQPADPVRKAVQAAYYAA